MEMGMQNFRKMEFTPPPPTIRNLRVRRVGEEYNE